MKRIVLGFVLIGAIAIAAVVLARAATSREQERSTKPEQPRVTRRAPEPVVSATGVVKPRIGAEVRVGSRISGVVRRLFVRIGDRVEKGRLLAELDSRELRARRDQANASLALARANLAFSEADLRRKRELAAARIIASSELDLAERAQAVAEQQLHQTEADVELAITQLDYARIHAPIAGVVSSISTQEGETVAASFAAPTFVTLLDLDRLEVWAYVDETDIGRIRPGQAARFTVDSWPDHEVEGQVTAVYPQAEIRDNVVNYVTVIRFTPPADRTLRPEMTAAVKIALE